VLKDIIFLKCNMSNIGIALCSIIALQLSKHVNLPFQFATILLVIFVGTVLAACLAFFYRGAIDEKMTEGLHYGLDHYTDNYDIQGEVDTMQQKMSCCGVESYEDWENTTWYREHEETNKTTLYPESCCEGGVCDYPMVPGNDSALFNQVSGQV